MIRPEQITFNKSIYYVFDIPLGHLSAVKEGDSVKVDEQIAVLDKKNETVFVESFGDIIVKKDSVVKPGDILCKRKSVLKNESMKSEVDGTVVSINENVIEIKIYNPETKLDVQTKAPFAGKIEKIDQGKILISFSAIQLNLLAAKGSSSCGNLYYKDEKDLLKKPKSKQEDLLDDAIVVTKIGSVNLYPKVSALGALGLIVNSIDFQAYDKISVLEVPLGAIGGFGDLIEDETLVKWFKSIEGQKVWFDATLNRLVVPSDKCPSWIKTKI